MKSFLIRWVITTIAVLAAAHIVPGIDYHQDWGLLLTASLLLGLVNAVLKPFLILISLPLLLLTFGLFTFVINSFLLLFVSKLVRGFDVCGWGSAFWGSLVISFVTILLKGFQSQKQIDVSVKSGSKTSSSSNKVIDI